MKTKLIMVEGIPGSGKTTFAGKIAELLKGQGQAVNLYLEGMAHPADLAWTARLSGDAFQALLAQYKDQQEQMQEQTRWEGEFALISYTQLHEMPPEFYEEMSRHEVYDLGVSADLFCKLHEERWRAFGEKAALEPEINIFECAYFQNHINELMFWHKADEKMLLEHLTRLQNNVSALSPVLIYLSQPDIEHTIGRIAKERVSEQYGNWIDKCIEYCENSPFGKEHTLLGFEGALEVFRLRKQLELKLLPMLPLQYKIVEYEDGDWEGAWAEITELMKTLL